MTFPVSRKPMAEVIRTLDWSSTPMGPTSGWPVALKVVVNLMLESDFPKAIVWGPHLITIHNDAFLPILGNKPLAIGRPFSDVWAEAWETIGPIADKAFAGDSTFIKDFPLDIDRNGSLETAYFTFCYSPIRDDDGAILGMMDTVVETTATVRARQTEEVLKQELAHRVKNMLTVANSVVSSTLRHSETIDEAKTAVSERLASLAVAQDLSIATGKTANLAELVRGIITPHVGNEWHRISLTGPQIVLESGQVTALSLVLFELATNAVKYGALSTTTGGIGIHWSQGDEGAFEFEWVETQMPVAVEPSRRGFGSQLMTRIAPGYFQGSGQRTFSPGGFRYALTGTLQTPLV